MTKTRKRPPPDYFHGAGVALLWASFAGVVGAYLLAFAAYFIEPAGWLRLLESKTVRGLPAYTTVWLVLLCSMVVLWITGLVLSGWRMWSGRKLRWGVLVLMAATPGSGIGMLWVFRWAAEHFPPFCVRLG